MDFDNTFLLYKVAKYYYVDRFSQQEIAEKINISRSQISRLLKKALDIGIVTINVSLPSVLDKHQIAQNIEQQLSLKNVILTSSSNDKEINDTTLYIGAANYLKDTLINSKNIGIGWGETLYNVSLHLSHYDDKKERTFIAAAGTSGTNNPYFQTNTITDRFAEKFHANAYYNNFPSCINIAMLSPLEEKRWSALTKNWKKLDTVVVGLAGISKIGELYPDEFENPAILKNIEKEMKGDILANFFTDNHVVFHFPHNMRISSLDMKSIQTIKKVICIAHGALKVDAIISAAKQGYFNELITDETTGRIIIEKLEI